MKKANIPFPIGAPVWLLSCPTGQPGVVEGFARNKVVVRWRDLDYTGRYPANRLIRVEPESRSDA